MIGRIRKSRAARPAEMGAGPAGILIPIWEIHCCQLLATRPRRDLPRKRSRRTQNSPRCFQRGPKCFGAQMHRTPSDIRPGQNDMPLTAVLIYPLLRLSRKVNSRAPLRCAKSALPDPEAIERSDTPPHPPACVIFSPCPTTSALIAVD